MNKAKGIAKFILAAVLLFVNTGCWDRVEIEERGFVVGTALDSAEQGQVKLTFQIAVPTQMKGGSGQKNEGGSPYINLSSTASSVFKAARKMSNEISRPPYLAHNQIIVISDALAGTKHLGEVLDLFVRDPENRRASNIMVSQGDASEILSINPKIETLPVQYIRSTQENPDKSESITPPTNMGELHDLLLSKTSYALPRVQKTDDNRISTAGAAVFNGENHKFMGYLNKDETTGRNMIQGTIKTASLELFLGSKELVVEVREFNRVIKVRTDKQGLPIFDLDISVRSTIGESELEGTELTEQLNREIKRKAEKKILQLVSQVVKKSQMDYKSDFLGFGDKLYEQQYALWKKYREDWDRGENIYGKCTINTTVDVKIRTIGTITNTK